MDLNLSVTYDALLSKQEAEVSSTQVENNDDISGMHQPCDRVQQKGSNICDENEVTSASTNIAGNGDNSEKMSDKDSLKIDVIKKQVAHYSLIELKNMYLEGKLSDDERKSFRSLLNEVFDSDVRGSADNITQLQGQADQIVMSNTTSKKQHCSGAVLPSGSDKIESASKKIEQIPTDSHTKSGKII